MNDLESVHIGIEASECLTSLGDAKESCQAMLAGVVGLRATPVLGKDGGDEVPLAYTRGYDETVPPRWNGFLDSLLERLPDFPWGSARYPVFVTSSNFDVGSIYSYRNTGDTRFLEVGPPGNNIGYLKKHYGWGENIVAVSHACVSAHVGIEMASRYLNLGVCDKALVLAFDYISPFVAGGFHSLKILNDQFPAPYQDRETGSIGLGDGSGFVVLSKEVSSFRIESNFLFNEMYHFTANDPSGGGFRASAEWLKNVSNGRSVWVKGHGTGTLDAGRLEVGAFQEIMPDSPIVSWKGSLGHTLGSCGIVELAIVIESIKRGQAPGTVGSKKPVMAENVALDNVNTNAFNAAALFSNAFGGAHAGCLISYD